MVDCEMADSNLDYTIIVEDPDRMEELGISEGINEVIVTTERDGVMNAAPIGIIKRDRSLTLRLFLGTHTYENILENGTFVANVTHDPLVFVEAALAELPESCFLRQDGLLTLKDAESWALFKTDAFRSDIVIARVEFVKGAVIRKDFRAVNRGVSGIVEAAISATRYFALGEECYLEDIRRLRRIIKRCGGPREFEAMARMEEILGEVL